MEKQCTKCSENKLLTDFGNDKSKKDGKNVYCRSCKSIMDKEFRNKNLESKREKDREYARNNSEANRLRAKTWYYNNQDKARARNKQYFKENYNKIKETQAKWDIQNSDKIKEYMRNYVMHRCKTDPQFQLRKMYRDRFRACVKRGEVFEYLDCDFDFFQQWIEYQFTFDPQMTWENHGTYWHYDHVVPCASYDLTLEENVQTCFHWSNVRPLKKEFNLSKKAKILVDVIEQHKQVIKNFCDLRDVPST